MKNGDRRDLHNGIFIVLINQTDISDIYQDYTAD